VSRENAIPNQIESEMLRSDMFDSRLIGTWRSDARKTSSDIAARLNFTSEKNQKKYKKLLSLFGKLQLRYTRTHCHSRLGTHKTVAAYKVVAKDEFSAAVLSSQPLLGKQISHIHFEGDYYWIYLGPGGLREFFKRVSTETRRSTKKTVKPR
jgi:hypothetical protein